MKEWIIRHQWGIIIPMKQASEISLKSKKAGRPKGSMNKRTRALSNRLLKEGNCPASALVRIAKAAEREENLSLAVDAWKAVLPYIHAKPKAVEFYPNAFAKMAKDIAALKNEATKTNKSDIGTRLERAIEKLSDRQV